MENKELDWCPTQGGTTQGYEPWYREGVPGKYGEYSDWKPIQIERSGTTRRGIPHPINCGVLLQICLYGYEQAMALAWSFAAEYVANSYRTVEVKVVPYEIVYDIKARNIEGEEKTATAILTKKPL